MKCNLDPEKLKNEFGIQRINKIPKIFTPDYEVGVVNGCSETVADMLKRIEYCISFIKANFDVDQKKYAETLKFLKFFEGYLKNKRPKMQSKQILHYVVDVVHEIEDMHAENDEIKKKNEEIALTLNMLIDLYERH